MNGPKPDDAMAEHGATRPSAPNFAADDQRHQHARFEQGNDTAGTDQRVTAMAAAVPGFL